MPLSVNTCKTLAMQGETAELWYNDKYTEAQFIAGWNGILQRFGTKPNLLGIDIKVSTTHIHNPYTYLHDCCMLIASSSEHNACALD